MRTGIKITFLFLFVIVISLLPTFYFSLILQDSLQTNIEASLLDKASNIMLTTDIILYNKFVDLQTISSSSVLKSEFSSTQEITDELLRFKEEMKSFSSLSFFDLNGIKLADTEGEMGSEDLSKFVNDFSRGKKINFQYSSGLISAAALIENNGIRIGIVKGDVNLNDFEGIFQEVKDSVVVVDKEGNVILTNDPLYKGEKNIDTPSVREASLGLTGVLNEFNPYYEEDFLTAYVSQTGYNDFKGSNWATLYSVSRSSFFSLASLVNTFMFFGGAIIILAILLSFLLTKEFSKPIATLEKVTRDVMAGKEVKLPPGLGELATSFGMMLEDLSESRKKLEEYSKTIEHKVGVRTKEAEKTKKAMLSVMEDLDKYNKQISAAQKRLGKRYESLKEEDIKKDRFISIAAHELKTPLSSIHGFAKLLVNEKILKDKEKREKYLGIISTESLRLAKLVTEILDLSRIDIGTMKYDFKSIDPTRVMENAGKVISIPIKEKGLKFEYQGQKLPKIIADKERLMQVVTNLLTNALKYTPKGKIMLKSYKDNGNVHVEVSDTGMGIEKKYLDKIFERFYQVESEITRKTHGTGLGLSLCKEFIEAMEGKIWVESELGKGSTFHFTIPIKK